MSTISSYVYNLKKEYYEKSIKELDDKISQIEEKIEEIDEEIYVLDKYNKGQYDFKIDNLLNTRDELSEILDFYLNIRNDLEENFEELSENT